MDYKSTRTLTNITNQDFTFAWDKQEYTLKAGETETYPTFLAEHGAKHLAEWILIHGERKMFDDLIDSSGKRTAKVMVIEDLKSAMDLLLDGGKNAKVEEKETPVVADVVNTPVNTPSADVPLENLPLEELRAKAKEKGIKNAHVKGRKKLLAEMQ